MSVSSLALDTSWRDYWGNWNSFVEPQMSPLEASTCHAPRFALIPPVENQIVPASGKIIFNFHLVPGSIIYGFYAQKNVEFVIQLTDVGLGHKFWQEPETSNNIITRGSGRARFPSFTLLPTPHPVVGEGLFTVELWAAVGARVYVILAVAEVTDCPVR